MRYMLLLYSAADAGPAQGSPEQAAEMQQWFAYTEELAKAGCLIGGEPLHGIDTATTVRVREGKTVTTDGPFAETKETLGGYYMIDVETLDEALEWAAKTPLTTYGSVEVRPIMEIPAAAEA
ncbi:MAG: YciI family protein [Acidimicrobiia bacterium]|nr:YciI family protein [Acidimicrobiia bacterium]